MKDINLTEKTRINPIGRERFYSGSGKTAVLIFHGYTGYTGEMDYLGRKINRETGYTVYIPRLPGHGTTTEDFRQSNARDWLRMAYDSYLKLRLDHDRVYLAGLSMGGLLAILTATKFRVEKIILIATALYARDSLLPFTHIFKYFLPVVKKSKDSFSSNDGIKTEFEKSLHDNYWTEHYSAQLAELHKLMLMTRKKLPEITSDTLILASTKDQSVPMKAAYQIQKKISSEKKEMIIFKSSPHVINNGPEKEKAARVIIDFLK